MTAQELTEYKKTMQQIEAIKCACHSLDRFDCYEMRYNDRENEFDEYCECSCHEIWEDFCESEEL